MAKSADFLAISEFSGSSDAGRSTGTAAEPKPEEKSGGASGFLVAAQAAEPGSTF